MMDEKLRPGFEVMQPQPYSAGVTPNPASTLAWPMSYSSRILPNHERTTSSPADDGTAGTRYDPIRQEHDTQYSLQEAKHSKRKRLEGEEEPVADADVDHQFAYSYEPQKLVTPTNSLQSGKRSHVCDICGATFTRQHNLKSHFLTHTSSKKEFICSECGSEFRRSHDLKRHQKLHTGEKPFACVTCGRRFARADALGRHTKSTGDAGCVNSRKTVSDAGSTGDQSLVSPIDPAKPSDGKGVLGPSGPGNQPSSSPDVESQHFSISELTDVATHAMSANQFANRDELVEKLVPQSRAALPPLRAAFPFDHNQSFAEASNTREILPSPPFGLPGGFEARSSSAHPLSFDRSSVHDSTSALSSQPATGPSMVPMQHYRQLEAEHQAAMERLRQFEGHKEDSP